MPLPERPASAARHPPTALAPPEKKTGVADFRLAPPQLPVSCRLKSALETTPNRLRRFPPGTGRRPEKILQPDRAKPMEPVQRLTAPRAVLCLSGGMDSTSLLLHLLAARIEVHGLSFNYGQRHAVELQRLETNLEYLRRHGFQVDWQVVDLRSLQPLLHSALTDSSRPMPLGHYAAESMRETVVPNRNAIFAAIAYAWALSLATRTAEPVAIGLAVHSGDHAIYPDCRPPFYEALLKAFALGNWESDKVVAYLPYLEWDKARILADGQRCTTALGLDFAQIYRATCTSYLPDAQGRSHGLTGSDVERILAFDQLGLVDPLEYQRPWNELVVEARRLMAEHEQASPQRPE